MKIGFIDYSHEERNRILSTLKMLGDQTALDEFWEITRWLPHTSAKTGFRDVWTYRTHDSGVTIGFLQGFLDFFSHFDDALDVIDNIIDDYRHFWRTKVSMIPKKHK